MHIIIIIAIAIAIAIVQLSATTAVVGRHPRGTWEIPAGWAAVTEDQSMEERHWEVVELPS
jgi:hypothetical protein